MFTAREKEMLDAMKKQMDAEEREAFNQMSEQEIKECLAEAEKEMKKMSPGELRKEQLKNMSFLEFAKETHAKGFLDAFLARMLLKHPKGLGCFVVVVIVVFIIMVIYSNNMN